MHFTIFDTPLLGSAVRVGSRTGMKLAGWRVEGGLPSSARKCVLVVPPQGTRSQVHEWKTGFHHIAQTAGLPILLADIDDPNKRVGIGPPFQPSGDIESDMLAIKAFYAPMRGRQGETV